MGVALVAVLAGVILVVVLVGGDGTAKGVAQPKGDMTTGQAVVEALKSTGYKFRYRRVPRLEGYEIVSGEAIQGKQRVQFAVEIRLAGTYKEVKSSSELNPQPPLLRYGFEERGSVVGNIVYLTEGSAPRFAGKSFELESSKAQTTMSIHIGVALSELFSPEVDPGV
jgi:hypothetical protein